MKPSIRSKLEQLAARLDEVDGLLAEETAARDMDKFRKLSRERAEVEPVVALYRRLLPAEGELAGGER